MSNILLIAGGNNQRSLAEEIINSGHTLILVDPLPSGPCTDLSSIHIQCDTRFYLDIIKEILDNGLKIDGVTSDQSDASLISVSKVGEYFNLPHMPSVTVKDCLNKFRQYQVLDKNHVYVPLTKRVDLKSLYGNKALLNDFFSDISSKAVIKPSDSQGSKGVQIIESLDSMYAKLHSTTRETSCGEIIIQEYIEGPEFSLDAVILDGALTHLVLASKYHYLSNPCIDERNTFFNDVPKELSLAIIESVSNAANALNLDNTLVHAELIHDIKNNTICLIEISPRGGGGSISSKIVPYLTGYNANQFLISRCLGHEVSPPSSSCYNIMTRKCVVMRFLPELHFRFDRISIGSPRYSKLLHCELPKGSGEFRKIHDSRDRVGYFVIGHTDVNLLMDDEERMLESLQFLRSDD